MREIASSQLIQQGRNTMKKVSFSLGLGLFVTMSACITSCRTVSTNSSEKSLPIPADGVLTPEVWIPACQAELANPVTGAASRQELVQLANTTNCATAFPAIKKIVDSFVKRS